MPINKKADYYRKKFAASSSGLEEAMGNYNEDMSVDDIKTKLGYSKENLHKIIEKYLGNDPALKKIANKIIKDSKAPLTAVGERNNKYFDDNPETTDYLEVIVQTDGSRPSFMIRDGGVDLETSPVGEWENALAQSESKLKYAIQCVGRINLGIRHIGTGFLIHRNFIVTNRHVLQSIALEGADGKWKFAEGAHIDFGHEYQARASVNPRALKKLTFCGPDTIDRKKVDHKKLDLALIEIEPVADNMVPLRILEWDQTDTWVLPDTTIFTIGYPGPPAGIGTYPQTLLDKLFKKTYGCKRLAPGKILTAPGKKWPLHLTHDATTLGGNSGSAIFARSKENLASGLHYGGDLKQPRENWGQVLGRSASIKNSENETLSSLLKKHTII